MCGGRNRSHCDRQRRMMCSRSRLLVVCSGRGSPRWYIRVCRSLPFPHDSGTRMLSPRCVVSRLHRIRFLPGPTMCPERTWNFHSPLRLRVIPLTVWEPRLVVVGVGLHVFNRCVWYECGVCIFLVVAHFLLVAYPADVEFRRVRPSEPEPPPLDASALMNPNAVASPAWWCVARLLKWDGGEVIHGVVVFHTYIICCRCLRYHFPLLICVGT